MTFTCKVGGASVAQQTSQVKVIDMTPDTGVRKLCLLAAKPARNTALCLLRTFRHALIELVNFSFGLCTCLGCNVMSLFAALLECLLGIPLALLKSLLRVGGLRMVSF